MIEVKACHAINCLGSNGPGNWNSKVGKLGNRGTFLKHWVAAGILPIFDYSVLALSAHFARDMAVAARQIQVHRFGGVDAAHCCAGSYLVAIVIAGRGRTFITPKRWLCAAALQWLGLTVYPLPCII